MSKTFTCIFIILCPLFLSSADVGLWQISNSLGGGNKYTPPNNMNNPNFGGNISRPIEMDPESVIKKKISNIIYDIGESWEVAHLSGLNLNSSQLFKVISALKDNERITKVNLSKNHLDIENYEHIFEAINANKSITELDLSQTKDPQKKSLDSEITKRIAQIINSNRITHLNFSENSMDDDSLKLFCDAMVLNKSITHLNLSKINISKQGFEHISNLLKNNKIITYLELKGNTIGIEDIEIIREALESNNTIKTLDLSESNFVINLISDALLKNKSIKYLKLSNITISKDNGNEQFSKTPQVNKSITYLNLSNNKFVNAEPFIAVIQLNESITSLDLSSLRLFSTKSFTQITEVLSINKSITYLNFSKNNLWYRGELFSKVLRVNDSITTLDLREVAWDITDIKHVFEALKFNKGITTLFVSSSDLFKELITEVTEVNKKINFISK